MTASANFSYGIEKIVTEPLFQYDIGQKLSISGLEVDETTEIHFKSPYSKIAKIATGTLSGSTLTVDIPDEFLENSGIGLVWVCLTDENAVTTIRTISIPIKERAKPDGYVSKGDGTYKKFDDEIAKLNAGFQNCEKKLNIGAVTSASSLISYKEKDTIYTGTIAYQAEYSGDFLMFIINGVRYLLTSDGHLWRFNSLTATTPTKLTYTAAEVESLLDDYDEAVISKLNLKADKATTLAGYGIIDAYDKTYLDKALKNKLDKMPFDTVLAENSPNYVTSGTVYSAVNAAKFEAISAADTMLDDYDESVTTKINLKADKDSVDSAFSVLNQTVATKYDSSNVENGSGTLSPATSEDTGCEGNFIYSKNGNTVTVTVNMTKFLAGKNYVRMSGLPFKQNMSIRLASKIAKTPSGDYVNVRIDGTWLLFTKKGSTFSDSETLAVIVTYII